MAIQYLPFQSCTSDHRLLCRYTTTLRFLTSAPWQLPSSRAQISYSLFQIRLAPMRLENGDLSELPSRSLCCCIHHASRMGGSWLNFTSVATLTLGSMQLISAFGFNTIQIANFSHHSPQRKLISSVHLILRSTTLIAISFQHSNNWWIWHIKTLSFTAPSTSLPSTATSCFPNGLGRPQITLPHVLQPITAFQCSILFNSCWPWSARSFSWCCHYLSTNLNGIPRFWTIRLASTTLTKGLGVDCIPPHFFIYPKFEGPRLRCDMLTWTHYNVLLPFILSVSLRVG